MKLQVNSIVGVKALNAHFDGFSPINISKEVLKKRVDLDMSRSKLLGTIGTIGIDIAPNAGRPKLGFVILGWVDRNVGFDYVFTLVILPRLSNSSTAGLKQLLSSPTLHLFHAIHLKYIGQHYKTLMNLWPQHLKRLLDPSPSPGTPPYPPRGERQAPVTLSQSL